jgi:hypothetical protein
MASRRHRKNYRKSTRKNGRKHRRNMRGGAGCGAMPPSSLAQGEAFQRMTANFHGGAMDDEMINEIPDELEMMNQSGGAVEPGAFPFSDARLLDGSARMDAQVGPLDKAINELPSVIQKGGAYGDDAAPVSAPGMLLGAGDYGRAGLSPQWETENLVNNAFRGKGGRRSRKHRKASRKHKKASRKHRKASRKHRKSSRKH